MQNVPSPAEALFLTAAEIAGLEERTIFLARACGDDRALRERVEGLLASHDAAGDFLEPSTPFSELQRKFGRHKSEGAGKRIGNYKLLQQIGEGGFGVVWMAEQEEPVRRRVALKIIKLGMDTKEVIARFGQERQALAMMDHPHIAKVLDAGATLSGRPFFVMELVRGVKITEYCDQAKLPTAERLQLFIAVCHAVQHAHQKGIIHRDLKPSNILVTLHDGVPVPKVIDFGVAKATQQQRLTDLTLFTQFEQMIGTPLYMSPEQAEMSGLDVDTRTDIYSLGVLLYELLSGRTPFDPEQLRRAGHDEIRRVIREQEPPKPSTALSTMAAEVRMNVAQHRHAEGPKLFNLLRGDLDWIVMRALEKDRTRRYDTANDLAQDIHRHLSNQPVLASPPSLGYLVVKFVRRHRTGVSVGTALALTVLLGAAVSVWLAVHARRQTELAEARREDADSSRQVAALAQRRAELSAKEVTHQLAGHYVNSGVERLAEGDYFGSWVWFAEALRLDEADPVFASIHRQRLGALSRACPAVLQVFTHNGFVLSAEFSPNGRQLVTASLDKTARIWDVNTGAPLIPPLEHADMVTCAAFSPDGERVVTGVLRQNRADLERRDRRAAHSAHVT